jgi:hypothetical protein
MVVNVSQRSPVILLLLAAATLALDAVAIYWLRAAPTAFVAGVLCDALCFSQLGLACIFAVFNPGRRVWSVLIVVAALGIAVVATAKLFDDRIWEMIAFLGTYATLLILSLWTVKHTRLWPADGAATRGIWQFSVGQLLALMTVVAVLLVMFRGSELIPGAEVATDVATSSALVVAALVIWVRPWHVLLRLATLLFVAGLLGLADWIHASWSANSDFGSRAGEIPISIADSAIQALVIFIWLEVGRIIPRAAARARDDVPAPA